MLKNYSFFQILYGVILTPVLIALFVIDRFLCVPLIWIKPPALKEFLGDLNAFVLSLYRLGFFTLVFAVYYLFKLVF